MNKSLKVSIADKTQELVRRVSADDYYEALFDKVLGELDLTRFGIRNQHYTDEQLVRLAHEFWCALPDHSAIRRGPFWLLCNIAEHVFDGQPESEGGEL